MNYPTRYQLSRKKGHKKLAMNDAYFIALVLIAIIDAHLQHGTRHYRRRSNGTLLQTLDEVVRAILDDDLI